MSGVALVTAVIIGVMLAENRLSRRNERALRASGAVLPPGDVFRALAVLYPASFLAMGVEGAWRASVAPGAATDGPSWAASGVLLFVASKALKYWAIHALGDRWSFRVLVQPGRPLVTSGPYRYVAHPNYVAVVGELAGAAMMVGARVTGPVMLVAFGIVLWRRLRFEQRALRGT
jgi:methyltransferase